jgi:hypothetical protein
VKTVGKTLPYLIGINGMRRRGCVEYDAVVPSEGMQIWKGSSDKSDDYVGFKGRTIFKAVIVSCLFDVSTYI